jgi:hypothetical protein
MDHRILPGSRRGMTRGRKLFILAAVLTVAGLLGLPLVWRASPKKDARRPDSGSPYAKTRLSVNYVGDAACVRCHAEIAETYRRHPMGHSLFPIADAASLGADPEREQAQFNVNGSQFSVEQQGNRVIHQETRRDASGRVISKVEAEVAYTIGSGRQALSYLIERDGFLFESPITWYAKDRRWGLSPAYERRVSPFERPILSECLFCHANRAERVTSALNRYRTPIFQGHAIGCERCHGPGELHVRRPEVVDGRDATIVNPAHLSPSLRDAVCEQCHLIGPRRIARIDARSEDFRPGLEFYRFWSVFVPEATAGINKFASQAEQMHESRCYRASRGRLGCISCHDPHVLPAREMRVAYFRERCLECHTDQGCRLPLNVRLAREPADDCIGCHMPRADSSNNAHVATTNHRVPRQKPAEAEMPYAAGREGRPGSSLVHFHRDLLDDRERVLTERDRGMALCRTSGEAAVRDALPLLEAAVAARPDDLAALECQGEVLGRLRRPEEGLAAYKMVLAREATRQTALEGAAHLAFKAGRHKESVEFWKRAVLVNPWRSDFHADMALAALQIRDWRTVAEASRQALRLNPNLVQVRKWLVQSELHLGDRDAARKEFEVLLGFDPPGRDELLRRFGSLAAPP